MRLLLLGTEGCHLCEEAREIVADYAANAAPNIKIELVDIAEHPEWQADYAVRIPVLLEPASRRELGWPFAGEQVAHFLQQIG
jgi:hypothetical protein